MGSSTAENSTRASHEGRGKRGRAKRSKLRTGADAHEPPAWPAAEELPDLDPIVLAFQNAHALVHTALRIFEECDEEDESAAGLTLRQGVEALEAVFSRLDEVNRQIGRLRRKAGFA